MTTLHTYIPQDRLRALARGEHLPERTRGAALFADISGFTPLTERLTRELGPRRGIEELTRQIDAVYDALIGEIEGRGGSVIDFAGDAITCWFDEQASGIGQPATGSGPQAPGDIPDARCLLPVACSRAAACALAMQRAMSAFADGPSPIGLKVAVTAGPACRFVAGDPRVQLLDALCGATIARLATAEHLAGRGEVLIDRAAADALGERAEVGEWRAAGSGESFAVLAALRGGAVQVTERVAPDPPEPDAETLRPWVQPAVFAREQAGLGAFLTELRPAVALFVRFAGIAYDEDEQAGTRLSALVAGAQAVLARHEGVLLQLTIGDKGSYLYAAFGVPVVHEDDACRAVQAALELQQSTSALGFVEPLQIGVTRGIMRTGAYGGSTRRTYGSLGDEVNVAARLMQAAAPGEILVSGRVHTATAQDFIFAPGTMLQLKGKAEPIPVFAVRGVRSRRAIRLQEPRYALPMVGRQTELQLIKDKLDLALAGRAQIVGIVADAGLGKSRLASEAIRAAREKGFAGYGGACRSDGVNTPYLAWKAVWQAFFEVDPDAPLAQQLRGLQEKIETGAPARLPALPLLSILLDLPLPDNEFTANLEPAVRRSVLHALLEDCLKATAQAEPVFIVLEDLHWIDALSHDLLEQLARAVTDCRVFFLLVYRPPQLERLQAPQLEALPGFTRVELHELNRAEAEEAIRAKLAQLYPERGGAVPPPLLEKLQARAQGNPFYLEELLNYLRDRGLDPLDPATLERIDLPDSLHTLILSRIDQLGEHEKSTLRVASIIGRLFRAAWLTGYYPELGTLPQVQRSLERLDRLDITPLETPEPELAYLFKHIVTREVSYESLPYATRARLHEQLAGYLERQIAEGALAEAPLLDALAYHYGRTDNHAKRREYLRKAGDAAFQTSALQAAAEYYARALDVTPPADALHLRLATRLSETRLHLGETEAARAGLQAALAAPAGAPAERAGAGGVLGLILCRSGDFPGAQQVLSEALPVARASGDLRALARVLVTLGEAYNLQGDFANARGILLEGLDLARRIGDVTHETYALIDLGWIAHHTGDLDATVRYDQEAYARASAVGDRRVAGMALNNIGEVAKERGDYATARDHYQRALAAAREIGAQMDIAAYLGNLANADMRLGQLDAARAGLREALTLAVRVDAVVWIVSTVMYFGFLARAAGQIERALALAGLVRRHPGWSSDNQYELDLALAEWALDPAEVEAGMAQGAELDWEATIEELLVAT